MYEISDQGGGSNRRDFGMEWYHTVRTDMYLCQFITEINAQVLSGNIIGYIYTYADTRRVKNERGFHLIFLCCLIMHLSLLLESEL